MQGRSQGGQRVLGEMQAFIFQLGQGSAVASLHYVLPENRLQALSFISFLMN